MTSTTTRPRIRLAMALAFGAAVALTLGIYGRIHDPTDGSLVTLFFTVQRAGLRDLPQQSIGGRLNA